MARKKTKSQDEFGALYAYYIYGVDQSRAKILFVTSICAMFFMFSISMTAIYLKNVFALLMLGPFVAVVYFVARWARRAPDSTTHALVDLGGPYTGAPKRDRVVTGEFGTSLNFSGQDAEEIERKFEFWKKMFPMAQISPRHSKPIARKQNPKEKAPKQPKKAPQE